MSSHQGWGGAGWRMKRDELSVVLWSTEQEVAALPHFLCPSVVTMFPSYINRLCSLKLHTVLMRPWMEMLFVISIKIASKTNAVFLLLTFKRLILCPVYHIGKTKKVLKI